MPFCCLNCFKKLVKKTHHEIPYPKNARNDNIHISLLEALRPEIFSLSSSASWSCVKGEAIDWTWISSGHGPAMNSANLPSNLPNNKKTWEFFGLLFCKKNDHKKKKLANKKQHKHHKNLEMQSCLKKSRFTTGGRRSLVTSHVFNSFLTLSTVTVYSEMVEFWSQNIFLML